MKQCEQLSIKDSHTAFSLLKELTAVWAFLCPFCFRFHDFTAPIQVRSYMGEKWELHGSHMGVTWEEEGSWAK